MAKKKKPVPKAVREYFQEAGLPDAVRQYFQETGRQGGKIGGKARWRGVSPEDRTSHAKRAVAAREAKRAKRKK